MAFSLIHFLFIIFQPLCTLAQNSGTIAVGSSLTAGEGVTNRPWLSPSGDFRFGFKQLQDKDQFLLSIWYDKIPDKTVVWYAKVGSPVPRGSRVELTAQFGLVLRDPRGRQLWNTDGILSDIAYGVLNNTGNLVLVASDTTWSWESFKNQTDTLLPSQELEIGGVLISRRSETNFSQGRFYLLMLDNGNLVLNTKSVPSNSEFDDEYYNSDTSDATDASNSGSKVILDERGYAYILRRNGETRELTYSSRSIPPTSDYYHRMTLNFDGVLAQYSHPRTFSGNADWASIWSQPDNICINIAGQKGSGACGYNSICSLNSVQRPVCECPRGFKLLDPNDTYGSCIPSFTQSCDGALRGSAEDLYDFVTLTDTDWPFSDFDQLAPSTEAECRNACLQDCFCAVAIFRSNSCWKKKLPLSNGKIDTSLNAKAFLKYQKRDAPLLDPKHPVSEGPKTKNDRGTLILVGSVLLGSSVFINILLVAAGCLGFFLVYQKKVMKYLPANNSGEINLRCFSFRELEEATNGFKEELGRGAFGIVYKGVIPVGSTSIVAVKKLDRVAQDTEKEFRTVVNVIGQTHHKNLVRLIGFCDEGQNRLLVYEYMSNGTLASFLFGDLRPGWSQRTKIAQGIARGLAYLHEECSTQIIHCDIKPQNILLDNYYDARISDFGLAKLLKINQSRTNTGIRGTRGYVAPEWFRNTKINAKVDVYSFGVLLLEIITCRKSLEDLEMEGGEITILTDWAWDCYQEGRLDDLVRDDMEALNDRIKLERFVKVGFWCIQEDSTSRPTMREVSQMLEGVFEVPKPPCPSPFSINS